MRKLVRITFAGAVLVLPAPSAGACPVCDRETGREVRAGIFDEHFGFNLAATVLPFGVLLALTAAIHFGWPGWHRPPEGSRPVAQDGRRRPV